MGELDVNFCQLVWGELDGLSVSMGETDVLLVNIGGTRREESP